MRSVVCPTTTLLLVGSKWRGILLRGHDLMAQRVQVVTSHKASDGLRQGWVQWRGVGIKRRWLAGWPRSGGTNPSVSFQ